MNVTNDWLNQQFPDLTSFSPLGSGGQKLVFAAQHPVEGDVVLKLIHPNQDAETVRREILAVDQIRSPRSRRSWPRAKSRWTSDSACGCER